MRSSGELIGVVEGLEDINVTFEGTFEGFVLEFGPLDGGGSGILAVERR